MSAETHTPAAPGGRHTSDWFLPSSAQWLAALCTPGLGGKPMPADGRNMTIDTSTGQAVDKIDKQYTIVGGDYQKLLGNNYWSSSAADYRTGIYVNLGNSTLQWYNYQTYANVRLMFAF